MKMCNNSQRSVWRAVRVQVWVNTTPNATLLFVRTLSGRAPTGRKTATSYLLYICYINCNKDAMEDSYCIMGNMGYI
jgi:hypothetical protein